MKKIIIMIISLNLVSCGILQNKKREFVTHKLPIFNEQKERNFNTNGVYIPENNIKGRSIFFYKNGSVKLGNYIENNQKKCDDMISEIHSYYNFFSDEGWGHYTIADDTIVIQAFNNWNLEFIYKRWIIELTGLIQDDSSFILISKYSYHGKDEFINEPIRYNLCTIDVKPDSTIAWFVNKKWFKKNLHESRKTEK